jgi:ABC-type glycerol-3-phosphate transport system substrate-binding protein
MFARIPLKKVILMLCLLLPVGLLLVCGKPQKPKFTILIKMMAPQEKWFRQNVIAPFAQQNNCEIDVRTFANMWEIETILDLESKNSKPSIGVVKVNFEMTRVLVGKKLLQPIDSVVAVDSLEMDKAEYHPLALALGIVDSKLYYVPRKLETRIMIYLKSKVQDAVDGCTKYRADITQALKEHNGYGLPANYTLEADPNEWDYFDIFVAGYYWSQTPYQDIKMPRVAHRAKKYEGTALGLVDCGYQLNASRSDILKMNTDPVVDVFEWEAVYKKHGIFNPGMWEEQWDGGNIYNAFKDGKAFLAIMQQIDCFSIHGWGTVDMPGFLADPDDMGVAISPRGVSLEIDKSGNPARIGTKKATTGGWWWGIPRTAPDPLLAYHLIKWITSHEIQAKESSNFGMMPMRKDILNNLNRTFEQGWVGDVFLTSVRQLDINEYTTIPLVKGYDQLGRTYIAAWYDMVADGNWGPEKNGKVSRAHIAKLLTEQYNQKSREVLGDEYPK